jgi:hypothetical protein
MLQKEETDHLLRRKNLIKPVVEVRSGDMFNSYNYKLLHFRFSNINQLPGLFFII